MPHFRGLLAGAEAMDQHFLHADFGENMPVLMALLGVWYRNLWGTSAHAVLPYAQDLARFPAYLQQLCMESLGKVVSRDGESLSDQSGDIVWGEAGTNGQHSFHQLLHQGTQMIPADFILPLTDNYSMPEQHRHLVACCLSQSRALLVGKDSSQVTEELQKQGLDSEELQALLPHKVIPGNRPSNTLTCHRLDPHTLGALIALYEHKVYVQSVIWGINAFDQWGVELGKQMGGEIYPALAEQQGGDGANWDSSTCHLIELYNKSQKNQR
jgi:glucose-6-phosphate isomerase